MPAGRLDGRIQAIYLRDRTLVGCSLVEHHYGYRSFYTHISGSRQLVSNSSDCSISMAPINLRQKASLQKTCTTRLFLLYDLGHKRLIVHNGSCASTTLPLLLGPVVVTSRSAGDRIRLNSFRYSHLPSDKRLPYLLHPFCRNSRAQSLR